MSEKTVFSRGSFFHGTRADLKIGELIVTGKKKNYNDDRKSEYVYFAGTLDAVALENTQKMFDDLDINENVGNYDPEFHIYKLLRQMEIMTGQLEHWSELMAGTYRSFANVCKDVKFDREKPGGKVHE